MMNNNNNDRISKEGMMKRIEETKKMSERFTSWDSEKVTRFLIMISLFNPDIITDFEETEDSFEGMREFMVKDIMKNPSKWGVSIQEKN